jgi:hypothetical protein
MKRSRWPALLVLLLPGAASAQLFVPVPAGGIDLGFSRARKSGAFSFSLSRGYGGFYGPVLVNPYGPAVGRVRVTEVRIVTPPPVIIALAPPPPADLLTPPARELPPYDQVMGQPPPEPPLPGREAGRFRPLEPDNRDRARRPVRPEPPPEKPPEKPPPEQPGPKEPPRDGRAPRLPRGPLPDPDPRVESARQVALGKEAFARGEYGRAAERFRQAIEVAPNEPPGYLLLGQAQLALGNYRRAFDALQTGLALRPDWPAEPFRPIELYGGNVVEYAAHVSALEDALAANPNDAVLLFLCGYALWFDGRKAEARPLFERAGPALPDPGVVERFLRALPDRPAV